MADKELISAMADILDQRLQTFSDSMDQKMDQKLQTLSDSMDRKLQALSDSMDQKMDQKLQTLSDSMDRKLQALSDSMDQKMDQKLQTLSDSMDQKLQTLSDSMDQQFKVVNNRLDNLERHLELETDKSIKIIAEGHLDLSRKLDVAICAARRIETDHEMTQLRLHILENNVREINERLTQIV